MQKTIEELFHLTQAETGIVSRDAYPDVAAIPSFTELYRYQIPVDRKLTFKPGHTFAILARKLPDQALDGAVADDGGAETIEVVEANEVSTNDMVLKPTSPAGNDAYYFGYRYPFSGLTVKYTTAATSGVTIWEYWNGSAWVALSGVTDGTAYWITAAGTHDVTWTLPKNWTAAGAGDSADVPPTLFWVRCRVTTAGDTALGDQAWIHPDPTAMEDTDKVRVEIRSQNELARRPLIDGAMYSVVDEFTDRDLVYRLDIGEPVLASGGMWVVILVKAKAPIDVSACYFDLTCDRQRQAVI